MAPTFRKLCLLRRSQVSTEAVSDSSPPSSQPDYRADMALAASELPADNAVGNASLLHADETGEKDEWIGELHLEATLALLLLRKTPSSEDITSLKDSLLQESAAFRHDDLCRQLRRDGVRQYQSSEAGHFQGHIKFRKVSLGWIGAIRRRGTLHEQQILEHAIVGNVGSYGSRSSSESNGTNPIQSGVAIQEESSGDSDSTDSEVEIWRYTKALQEKFAGKSVAPVYKDLTLRGYPPKFGSEVKYRGKTFTAKAGNKKLAKHRSSKKMCKHLELKVAGF
ncbi:hypothetical protein Z517_11745 [Fonsecaea pedrosoi CBS 271.37]|uniref:DRBM domain-containing protein n=1 Tax=Fonsecaea pedrosoi CBS 271.37 TaxID=1442368 RepID=A0A0D2GRC3_9EURO|nr:uncharacterized protein Z517_11745 [Fonsecaea pedrosoi CBS 271.37]KIW74974.1 hypothetical protein Z517_11745 [Fonsecaea pedrosoi CBS 271.37]